MLWPGVRKFRTTSLTLYPVNLTPEQQAKKNGESEELRTLSADHGRLDRGHNFELCTDSGNSVNGLHH